MGAFVRPDSMRLPWIPLLVLTAVICGVDATHAAKLTADEKKAAVESANALLRSQIYINAGWALGVAGDALNQANDPPGSEKLDLAPFINTGVVFGDGSGWTANVMALFANFGRLVNKANVAEFSEETSGTAVRRALMADFALMSRLRARGNIGVAWTVLNTGFIMDAQGRAGDENPLDAASYLFTGPSLYFRDPDQNRAIVDLFVGISEVMTGDEVFDFSEHAKPAVRIRPRFWIQFQNGLGANRPLQIGFWGDLGTHRTEPDAVTAYLAMPLKMPFAPSDEEGKKGTAP